MARVCSSASRSRSRRFPRPIPSRPTSTSGTIKTSSRSRCRSFRSRRRGARRIPPPSSVGTGKFVRLGDEMMRTVTNAANNTVGVGRSDTAYRGEIAWGTQPSRLLQGRPQHRRAHARSTRACRARMARRRTRSGSCISRTSRSIAYNLDNGKAGDARRNDDSGQELRRTRTTTTRTRSRSGASADGRATASRCCSMTSSTCGRRRSTAASRRTSRRASDGRSRSSSA